MPQLTKHSLSKMEQVCLSSALRKPHKNPLYKGWRGSAELQCVLKLCGSCVELDTAQDACFQSSQTLTECASAN